MKFIPAILICALLLTACNRDASHQAAALVYAVDVDVKSNDQFSLKSFDTVVSEPFAPSTSRDVTYTVTENASALLNNFYKQLDVAPEHFVVGSNDTVLICRQGTALEIPGGTFVFSANGLPTQGPIVISVKEYYQTHDVLLAPVSCESGGALLQNAGMVYVDVKSNGMPCKVADGKSIGITFAGNERTRPDFQLFTGVQNQMGTVEWKATESDYRQIDFIEETPAYPGGIKYLNRHINAAVQKKIRWSERQICKTAFVDFTVSENGLVENVTVRNGISPRIDESIVKALTSVTRWRGSRKNGNRVSATMTLIARMDNGEIRSSVARQLPDTFYAALPYKQELELISKWESDALTQRDSPFARATRLGWIAGGRFYNDTHPRTNYFVYTANEEAEIKLVFPSKNIVLVGTRQGNGVKFRNVPIGVAATVIAISTDHQQTQLAKHNVIIDNNGFFDLSFMRTEQTSLREQFMAMLD